MALQEVAAALHRGGKCQAQRTEQLPVFPQMLRQDSALLCSEQRSEAILPTVSEAGRPTKERLMQMLVLLWVSLNRGIEAASFVGF